MTIRVVSLNCWGGRVPSVVDYLAGVDADVYCLQEVYWSPSDTPSPLVFDNKYRDTKGEPDPHPRLYRDLCEMLPEHQAFFSPHAQGYLHDGATTEYKVRYGIATFVRNTLPVIEQASTFAFGEYRAHRWGDPPLPRTAHAVRLYNYEDDSRIVVAHMHGLWDKRGKMDTPERRGQAQKLGELVQRVSQSESDKLVVCGDFNVLPESETLSLLQAYLDVRELVTSSGFTDTRTSHYKKNPRFADYMLVSRQMQVQKFEVVARPEVSDHRPLLLEFD